jgi:putative proteasome-type protease
MAPSLYDVCRVIGEQINRVAEIDRKALERDDFTFNVHFLLGGQIRGESPGLYLIYPQGNPLSASRDSPFLQIGECKYGRPILDRGIRYETTTLEEAAKYALISIDSTMRSNATVGPPIDMILYPTDQLAITRRRRMTSNDPDLLDVHAKWEQALKKAVQELPTIRFDAAESSQSDTMNTDFILRPESARND